MRVDSRPITSYVNSNLLILAVILIGLCLLLISGCQQGDQGTGQTSTAPEPVQDQTTAQSEQPVETQTSDVNSEPENATDIDTSAIPDENGSIFSGKDLIISVDGQEFSMLEDAAELLITLGDDYAYNEAESCVYDGMDKTFDYGQIIVYTVPAGDIDLLDGIDILDQSIATTKGIQVGSSREDVLAVYGQPADDQYDLTYNTSGDIERVGDPRLTFYLDDDDNVNLISYYSGSNAQN